MNIYKTFFGVLTVILLLTLTACRSYEERVITKLNNLSERIDKYGKTFDVDDWEDAMEELADIHEEMGDCDFTREQLKEVGKADGRLSAIIAKEGAKALGQGVSGIIDRVSSYAEGFQEGAQENMSEDDIKEVEKELNKAFQSVEDN